jgi:hypothetical protein
MRGNTSQASSLLAPEDAELKDPQGERLVPIAQQAKGAEQVDLGADAPMTNTVHIRAESALCAG